MKIFFVGMHNKEGFEPLDSRTKTGKIIDKIIKKLPCECVKTNLCDANYLYDYPTPKWYKKYKPKYNNKKFRNYLF